MSSRRRLIVALAGADSNVVQHLMDEGRMPNLLRLVERGASGDILWPVEGTAISQWLTVTTGRLPAEHGIWSNPIPRADGFGVTRVNRAALGAPHVWECMGHGNPVHAINWPATHGYRQECQSGGLTVVADTFFYMEGARSSDWAAFPEAVFPRAKTANLLPCRVHADDLKRADRPTRLGRYDGALLRVYGQRGWLHLARTESIVGVASALAREPGGDLFVHFDLLEMLGLPGSDTQVEVLLYAYQLLDAALARLADCVGDEADIVVLTRPPSGSLDSKSEDIAPRGLAVLAAEGYQADGLLAPLTLLTLAQRLRDICGAGEVLENVPKNDLSDELHLRLQARHQRRCLPLRADREAIQIARERDSRLARGMLNSGS